MAAASKTQRYDWNCLPPELSQLVLALLPDAADLERARMVCRLWRATIASPSFRHLQALLRPRCPSRLLLYTHDASIAAASPPILGGCKDHSTSIPSTPSSLSKKPDYSVDIMQVSWRQLPALPMARVREWVGAQGLVCLRSTAPDLQSQTYMAGDPLIASSWKALPDPPFSSHAGSIPKLWSMVAHPPSIPNRSSAFASSSEPLIPDRQFSILLLHRTSTSSSSLHIFSSASNTWTAQIVPQVLVGGAVDWTTFSNSAASIGRHVYCIHGERRAMVRFDVVAATWELLEGAGLPSDLALMGGADHHVRPSYGGCLLDAPPKLVQGPKGRMLMMGASLSSPSSSVHVWEMERPHGWRVVARAPSRMWSELLDEARESRKCTLLPVRFAGEGEVMVAMACGSSRAIAFNLVDETWQWMHIPPMANCDLSLCFELSSADQ